MTVIELPDDKAAVLKAKASAEGLTLQAWITRLADDARHQTLAQKPFETGRGMFAQYGTAPSAEEIDDNRRDMFRNFGRDI